MYVSSVRGQQGQKLTERRVPSATELELCRRTVPELLEMARRGDQAGVGELWVRYQRYALRLARRRGAGEPDDAVAEAFRSTMSAIAAGRGPTVAFGPYLAAAVRSAVADQRARSVRYTTVHSVPDTCDESPVAERDEVLAVAFDTLTDRWRLALYYLEVQGVPAREAALLLGVPSANAAAALGLRARAALRRNYLALADEAERRCLPAGEMNGTASIVENLGRVASSKRARSVSIGEC